MKQMGLSGFPNLQRKRQADQHVTDKVKAKDNNLAAMQETSVEDQ